MNSHLTEAQIKSILTDKGKQATLDGKSIGECITIHKTKVGDQAFNEAYTNKLHKRKLENYLQTLYQMNGQVNSLLSKTVHNLVAVVELFNGDYLHPAKFAELFPKLLSKFEVVMFGATDELFEKLTNFKEFEDFYVVNYRGNSMIIHRDTFLSTVPDVKSGQWEGGCPREQIKALKAHKTKTKMKFYTKLCKQLGKVIVVSKIDGDSFTVFPSSNFNHKKFSDEHREKTFEEIKALIEHKYCIEKDLEWFKQYETEVNV